MSSPEGTGGIGSPEEDCPKNQQSGGDRWDQQSGGGLCVPRLTTWPLALVAEWLSRSQHKTVPLGDKL